MSGYQYIDFIDAPWLKKVNTAALIVEKPGITGESFDRNLYLRTNTLMQRAQDCKIVIDHLRSCEPGWNGKLVTCRISEGATLSAYLSDKISGIAAAMMLSGGCSMTLRDELLVLERKAAAPGPIGFVKKHLSCAYINLQMLAAHMFPQSILKWWHVIGDYSPATTLENVSIPLYLAHGSADINTPVDSAEALVEHFKRLGKNNLCYRCYEGYDHGYQDADGRNHWQEVIDDLQHWLESNVLQAVAPADNADMN